LRKPSAKYAQIAQIKGSPAISMKGFGLGALGQT
jgi:hypothetical protein